MPGLQQPGAGQGPYRFTHRGAADAEGLGQGRFAGELGAPVDILSYSEHATSSGPDSDAIAYVRCRIGDAVHWGVGQDTSVLTASVRAVLAAVNRAG
ncbi:alpha-isopropylmalate synthase regulatory domain-containing protein [Streptomyces sp. NPDC050636]|uniref:alpha-isopropylmalate synthase regulatory domain-containing protein n=1 Tax=Streptomyces sp. NPDC050636 TaxID=3154510 RepID=UPI00341D035B